MTALFSQPSEAHLCREEAHRLRMASLEAKANEAVGVHTSEIAGIVPQFPSVSAGQKRILADFLGKEIITALDDPDTVDIMVNDNGFIYQERRGEPSRKIGIMSYDSALGVIHTLAGCYGQVVNAENPFLMCELPLGNGPRIQCEVPPNVAAPSFTIRKKPEVIYTLDDYIAQGILNYHQREAIGRAVVDKKNIVVIGGNGSGKTTFVNALLHEMATAAKHDRQIIIEDTFELQTICPNRLFLRSSMHASFDKLLEISLRNNANRIILGEVRGKEAYSLVKAWNTGHSGGAATFHANNTCEAGIKRLKTMVTSHNDAPIDPCEDIALAIDVLMNIQKDESAPGGRRITELKYIEDWSNESGFVLSDLT